MGGLFFLNFFSLSFLRWLIQILYLIFSLIFFLLVTIHLSQELVFSSSVILFVPTVLTTALSPLQSVNIVVSCVVCIRLLVIPFNLIWRNRIIMGFSPFLQTLFLLSIVTATAATDVPPVPPVAGIAANALPVTGTPVREKRKKGRVNAELVSSAPANAKPASSVPSGVKQPQNPKPMPPKKNLQLAVVPKPQPSKMSAADVSKRVAFKLSSGALYNAFRAPSAAMIGKLIAHRLASYNLSRPFPSYHPTTKMLTKTGQSVNKPLRFGHPLTKKFEVDLTSPTTGKKVGSIYHNRGIIVPTVTCAHAKLTGARYHRKLASIVRPESFDADAHRAAKNLRTANMPIPSEGADVLAGASGAIDKQIRTERALMQSEKRMVNLRPSDEHMMLEEMLRAKGITNRNVIDICRNVLLPGQCANIGTPDNNNGRPAIRPTIATRYKVPFTNGTAAIIIQDSLAEVLRVVGAGTGQYRSPTLTNATASGWSSMWNWDGPSAVGWDAGAYKAPSYLIAATRSTFKFSEFPIYNDTNEIELIPQEVTVVDSSGSRKDIEMIPFDPASTYTFTAGVGANLTVNGFRATLYMVRLVNGVYALWSEAANLTGLAGVIRKDNWVIPSDIVGLYEISIENVLAGTVTVTTAPNVDMVFADMNADVVIPAGKADGSDFSFFETFVPQVRIDTLAAKLMFWAGFGENVEIAFGQFDEDEDGEIPPPNFDSWGALTRFRVKAMNDPAENGAYVPMIRRDLDAYNFRDVSTAERSIIGEQIGALMESTGTAGEHVIAEVMVGATACGNIQGIDPKSGLVDVEALSMAYNLLRQEVFATGNDDHESVMADFLLQAARTLTSPDGGVNINFNGWLSGNDVTVV